LNGHHGPDLERIHGAHIFFGVNRVDFELVLHQFLAWLNILENWFELWPFVYSTLDVLEIIV
jgi:hypothetical protein